MPEPMTEARLAEIEAETTKALLRNHIPSRDIDFRDVCAALRKAWRERDAIEKLTAERVCGERDLLAARVELLDEMVDVIQKERDEACKLVRDYHDVLPSELAKTFLSTCDENSLALEVGAAALDLVPQLQEHIEKLGWLVETYQKALAANKYAVLSCPKEHYNICLTIIENGGRVIREACEARGITLSDLQNLEAEICKIARAAIEV